MKQLVFAVCYTVLKSRLEALDVSSSAIMETACGDGAGCRMPTFSALSVVQTTYAAGRREVHNPD